MLFLSLGIPDFLCLWPSSGSCVWLDHVVLSVPIVLSIRVVLGIHVVLKPHVVLSVHIFLSADVVLSTYVVLSLHVDLHLHVVVSRVYLYRLRVATKPLAGMLCQAHWLKIT